MAYAARIVCRRHWHRSNLITLSCSAGCLNKALRGQRGTAAIMWPVRVLQQKVSNAYYSYGLYCATHQLFMIAVSFFTFCFVCYPLTQIPFLGSVPSRYVTSAGGYPVPPTQHQQPHAGSGTGTPDSALGGSSARGVGSGSGGHGSDLPPAWWNGRPAGYVQQILVRAAVAPWRSRTLHALDAFRGPLRVAFGIVDDIGYARHETSDVGPRTFDEACLRVAEPRAASGRHRTADTAGRSSEGQAAAAAVPAAAAAAVPPPLPEYGCLLLSPTGLWGGSAQRFAADRDPLRTIYASIDGRYETLASSPPLRELLFGVPLSESGVSKYYMRSRQRVIYYAVTLVMSNYSAGLMAALRSRLLEKYPLSVLNYRIAPNGRSSLSNASSPEPSPDTVRTDKHAEGAGCCDDFFTHVTYGQSENAALSYMFENLPLIVAYVVLFLYIYFSVQKIEMVKSKWGLALSAVATVVASLLMSFSICVSFGMRPSVSSTDMFPYLVVIVGLENMMVLTRAVASTPHLEVPLRVAQGLGREGWNISKYLLTELVVLLAGFFMLVPAVQEFCLFAIVGLFVDFFLQMTFFATVLSIDIRRLELEDLNRHRVYGNRLEAAAAATLAKSSVTGVGGSGSAGAHTFTLGGAQHQLVSPGAGHLFGGEYPFFVLPRRVRFMNFVAQKRFMQSLIIVTVLLWIAVFVYNAGSIGKFLQSSDTREQEAAAATLRAVAEAAKDPSLPDAVRRVLAPGSPLLPSVGLVLHSGRGGGGSYQDVTGRAKYDNWERLSFMHWPAIFTLYNISVAGTYLTFLPSIKLSVIVDPDEAVALRRSGGGGGGVVGATADDDNDHEAASRGEDADDEDDASAKGDEMPSAVAGDRSRDGHSDGGDEAVTASNLAVPPQLSFLLNATVGLRVFGSSALSGGFILLALVAVGLVCSFGCVMLYRCMCSRNYHEWRPMWFRGGRLRSRSHNRGSSILARWRRHLGEGTALSLDGHRLPVECVAVDGSLAATSCLGGEIRVWDPAAGQLVVAILRRASSAPMSACAAAASVSETSWSSALRATASAAEASTPKPLLSLPTASVAECRSRLSSVSSAGELSAFIDTDFASMSPKSFASCLDEIQQQQQGLAAASSLAATSPTRLLRQHCDSPDSIGTNGLQSVTPIAAAEASAAGFEGCVPRLPSYAANLGRIGSSESLSELCHGVRSSPDQRQPSSETWPAIWCLTMHDGLVAAGCSDGSVELWDAVSGELRGVFKLPDGGHSASGITAVKLDSNRLLVGRADGTLDFAEITNGIVEQRCHTATSSGLPPSAVFRSSVRTSSIGWGEDAVRCVHLRSMKAHQGAVHFLEVGVGRAVTAGGGGQDASVLKIFSLDDACLLHALRGQAGRACDLLSTSGRPHRAAMAGAIVSALHVDTTSLPALVVCGDRVGSVFVWDLMNGQTLHSWNVSRSGAAECDSGIVSLVSSVQYVVASTSDGFIYVWNKSTDVLHHRIAAAGSVVSHVSLAFMTHRLLVAATADDMRLHMWDASSGDIVHSAGLPPSMEHLNHLHVISKQTILCSCGSKLLVLNFPKVREKLD